MHEAPRSAAESAGVINKRRCRLVDGVLSSFGLFGGAFAFLVVAVELWNKL